MKRNLLPRSGDSRGTCGGNIHGTGDASLEGTYLTLCFE